MMGAKKTLLAIVLGLVSTTSMADDQSFVFTPRFWYLTEPANSWTGSTTAAAIGGNFNVPMYGGAFGFDVPGSRDTRLFLTLFHGEATARQTSITTSLVPSSTLIQAATTALSSVKYTRTDAELLAYTPAASERFLWVYGFRFENYGFDTTTSYVFPSLAKATGSQSTVSRFYSLKGGLAASLPLDSDGHNKIYGNSMLVGGYQTNEGYSANYRVGLDSSVGYTYSFSPSVAADLRYRLFAYSTINSPFGKDAIQVSSGPMIGVNISF